MEQSYIQSQISEHYLLNHNQSQLYELRNFYFRYRKVLTHGDIWKNNLLFQYEKDGPSHCKLVDFQFIRYAPPAHDVMHFLHFATEKLVRDKKESVLLRIYYENLSKELQSQGKQVESEITRDEFFESCSEYKELALIQSLLSMNYILGQSTLGVDNSNYLEYEKYLLLHRNDYMWDFINRESYKSKITELLYELIDSYIMKKFPSIKAEV